jgi:hypothetical protein
MAKIARVAKRENLAKIGMRSLLNNFVDPQNPRPFNAKDPARQRQGINPNIEYRNWGPAPWGGDSAGEIRNKSEIQIPNVQNF